MVSLPLSLSLSLFSPSAASLCGGEGSPEEDAAIQAETEFSLSLSLSFMSFPCLVYVFHMSVSLKQVCRTGLKDLKGWEPRATPSQNRTHVSDDMPSPCPNLIPTRADLASARPCLSHVWSMSFTCLVMLGLRQLGEFLCGF